MLEFMREGGVSMWLMLAAAVVFSGLAATRPRPVRPTVLVTGCLTVLVLGMAGLGTGLAMVSRNYQRFPNPLEAVGAGIGEASHNATLAALLAAVLGAAAMVSARANADEAA